jgi:hypothetical protein
MEREHEGPGDRAAWSVRHMEVEMKKVSLIGSVVLVVALVGIVSCAVEPSRDTPAKDLAGEPQATTAEPEERAAPASPGSSDPAAEAATAPGKDAEVIHPDAGCSTVNFCNASGSNGTTCTQSGCSLQSAQNECRTEAAAVCGTILSPFVIHTGGGDITMHVGACSGGALSCGGNCCNTAATFCGGASHNVCCDGIHCSSSCPCV